MNSFIANNKQFFSLMLSLLLSSSLCGITVNNEPLENIIQNKEYLVVTNPEKNKIFILEIENENLDIQTGHFDDTEQLKDKFEYVCKNRGGSFTSRILNLLIGSGNYKFSYLSAGEYINFQCRTLLNLEFCLFESPLIHIASETINFQDCFFINPQVLNIIENSKESDYAGIQIIFHDQPEIPTMISGEVNLRDKETKRRFIVSNAKEIRFHFKPHVWNNGSPEDSETNSESIAQEDAAQEETTQEDTVQKNVVPENVNVQSDSIFSQLTQKCVERAKRFFCEMQGLYIFLNEIK